MVHTSGIFLWISHKFIENLLNIFFCLYVNASENESFRFEEEENHAPEVQVNCHWLYRRTYCTKCTFCRCLFSSFEGSSPKKTANGTRYVPSNVELYCESHCYSSRKKNPLTSILIRRECRMRITLFGQRCSWCLLFSNWNITNQLPQ